MVEAGIVLGVYAIFLGIIATIGVIVFKIIFNTIRKARGR